jgi:peptide/nickel transport system substrate-binding protein
MEFGKESINMGQRLSSHRWIAFLLIGCLVALGLGSCEIQKMRASDARVPQLVDSSLTDPKTFNTVLSQEANDVLGYIYEGLIATDGETGEIIPALAESWVVSPDDKRITYTLRPNLKWSDGYPLTADDVVFTYNDIYLNPKIPTDARDGMRIGKKKLLPSVRKLDDRRVEFETPEPFAPFLRLTGSAILPKHILEESVKTTDEKGQPKFISMWGVDTRPLSKIVVAGQYQLESYRVAERVTLRRNPYYWRKQIPEGVTSNIERVVIQTVESTDADFLQFRSGGLDLTSVSSDNYELLKQEENKRNFKIYNGGPATTTNYISFNLNKGKNASGKPFVSPIKAKWFNNVEFRQAIAYGIDRERMVNNIFRGLAKPQHSILPVTSPYYFSPEEGLKTYEHNLQKAEALLRQAGFKKNPQGQLTDADGNPVRFSLITNAGNKLREAMGTQVKQDLSKLGITVDFNPMAFNTLVDKLSKSNEWDCILLGFGGGSLEPHFSRNIWAVDGGLHMFNQGPPEGQKPFEGREVADWEQKIDDLYTEGAQEFDEKKRKAIYAEAQQIVQEQLPFIYMINPISFTAVRDRIQNVKYTALGGALWNLYELRLSENL